MSRNLYGHFMSVLGLTLVLAYQNCAEPADDAFESTSTPIRNDAQQAIACSSAPVLGIWNSNWSTPNDQLTIAANCSGYSSACASDFSISNLRTDLKTFEIQVLSGNNKAGCPTLGAHTCSYSISNGGNSTAITCDGLPTRNYTRNGDTVAMVNPVITAASFTPPPVDTGATRDLYIYFSTSPYNTGSLVAGADTICNTDHARPLKSSGYKALLSAPQVRVACATAACPDSEKIDWVLKKNTKYKRADGTIIGTTDDKARLKPLISPIATQNIGFWSGLNSDWTPHLQNCGNWMINQRTIQDVSYGGAVGTANIIDQYFLNTAVRDCGYGDTAFYLLCVEQ